jgi:hypothetical protein
MGTYAKSFLASTALGLLIMAPLAEAVNNNPVDKNDPVVQCREKCKSINDSEAYETCMVQCDKTHKKEDAKKKSDTRK